MPMMMTFNYAPLSDEALALREIMRASLIEFWINFILMPDRKLVNLEEWHIIN